MDSLPETGVRRQAQKAKLTKRVVDSLYFDGTQDVVWDQTVIGFGVRINVTGKTYFVKTRQGGKVKKITIGKHGIVSVDQARERAIQLLADVSRGIEPAKVEVAEVVEDPVAEMTFGQLCEKYIEDYASEIMKNGKSRKKDWRRSEQRLRRNSKAWWDMPISQITPVFINCRVAELKDTPVEANRFLALARVVFKFGKGRGYFTGMNPCLEVEKFKETKRTTRITEKQFPLFWKALEMEPQVYFRNFWKFTLFSGCRPDESRLAKWQDIHLEDKVWVKSDTKRGIPQTLPLTDFLIDVLKQTPRVDENPYVFVGYRRKRPIVSIAKSWNALLKREPALGGVVGRDVRRSFATIADSLKIDRSDIKGFLHHSDPSATGIYVMETPERLESIRQAMESTTKRILELCGVVVADATMKDKCILTVPVGKWLKGTPVVVLERHGTMAHVKVADDNAWLPAEMLEPLT